MALLLSRSDVIKLLPMPKAIEVVEQAFGELANGTAEMPQRTVFIDPNVGGWIAYMPAYLKTGGALGVKAVTVYKNNPSKFNLPTTLATILVQDQKTGLVLAVMDGGFLTAMRTGAVTGAATKHLARKGAQVAGIIGTGVQGRTQTLGMCAAGRFQTVLAYSIDTDEKKKTFAEGILKDTGVPVKWAKSVEEVCRESDVVSLATTSSSPIVQGSWWKAGAHINGIGSHAPGQRELDTATVVRAKVICDQRAACLAEAGDLQIPVQEKTWSPDKIRGDLGDVINGKIKGRQSDDEVTLFKSVGLAIQDISCAALVYAEAKAKGVGTEFAFS
ncbi:MAG: ornithine cyclodeaminase family protein [Dehalococcoidia bacterium]|nr:ornithine cyclodeaminase family protein [Dehalococcoidia bacterium]